MDEMERRLRAAMIAAAEQAPSGLMEAIRRRHRRHVRRVSVGCVAAVAAIAAAIPALTHAALPGTPSSARTTGPAVTPTSGPTASPGTLLLTCASANWGQLPSNWRAQSLRVGSLWFADGRAFGYVHYLSPSASFGGPRSGAAHPGKLRKGVMIVEVTDGSTAVLSVAPSARSYFRFVYGFNGPSANDLPAGDTGFTLGSCPRRALGPNGHVTDYYLGFVMQAGRSAPVSVWTSASARASWVIFTCPGLGCEGPS